MACSMPISLHRPELKVNRRCKEKNHHSGEFNYRISFVTVLQFVALLGIQPDAISFNTALGALEAVHNLCCRSQFTTQRINPSISPCSLICFIVAIQTGQSTTAASYCPVLLQQNAYCNPIMCAVGCKKRRNPAIGSYRLAC